MKFLAASLAGLLSVGLASICYARDPDAYESTHGFYIHADHPHNEEAAPDLDRFERAERRAEEGERRTEEQRLRRGRKLEAERAENERLAGLARDAARVQEYQNSLTPRVRSYEADNHLTLLSFYSGIPPEQLKASRGYDAELKRFLAYKESCGGCDLTDYTLKAAARFKDSASPKPSKSQIELFSPDLFK